VRFLIFGAGAMGSFVGGLLARSHDVTLVGRHDHVEAIRRHGLRVTGRTELEIRVRAVEEVAQAEPADVVVVTVKSYDTRAAVDALEPFWEHATFLSLQNGLGNVELLAERAERVLGGVTYSGVTFVAPGRIEHAGTGDTVLGPYRGTSLADTDRLGALFRESGIETSVTESIETTLWRKAVVNACFNPLTGLLEVRSGALARSGSLSACSTLIVSEAVAVARACGVALDEGELLERVRAVSHATARNKSSMLQDMQKGRRTEIDAINGAIARRGAERGIDCPANRVLTLLVKAAGELHSSEWKVRDAATLPSSPG
jgi:2-dehydropantoate 2-reductase